MHITAVSSRLKNLLLIFIFLQSFRQILNN